MNLQFPGVGLFKRFLVEVPLNVAILSRILPGKSHCKTHPHGGGVGAPLNFKLV